MFKWLFVELNCVKVPQNKNLRLVYNLIYSKMLYTLIKCNHSRFQFPSTKIVTTVQIIPQMVQNISLCISFPIHFNFRLGTIKEPIAALFIISILHYYLDGLDIITIYYLLSTGEEASSRNILGYSI